MAGPQETDWNEIISQIRETERAPDNSSGPEIVAQPGGELAVHESGRETKHLSTIPRDVMAASALASADSEGIAQLDPDGVERWRWASDGSLAGWVFEMAPLNRRFVFFAFRVPAMRNRLLLSVIEPDMDQLIGHEHHVVTVRVDAGRRIPVVCGSKADISCSGVREVRGVAAKFATYHSLRAHGHVPFSE